MSEEMRFFGLAYDLNFDQVAVDSRRLAPGRWLAAFVVIGLVGASLGWKIALAWGGALIACELWTLWSTRPHMRGDRLTAADRLSYIASAAAGNAIWLSLSLLFWFTETRGSQFVALLIWSSLLLNAMSFAFRSSLALWFFGAPVSLVMTLTPILAPRFAGAHQLLAGVGVIILAAYALICARRNVVAARALAEATAALEEQKRAAEAANQAKSSFLAMMSHELRTPMNAVLGMAHALDMSDLNPRQRDYVRTLVRSGDGLMAILNDVLDLAKIEAGRLEIEPAVFDLHETLTKARELWAQSAADKGVALVCDLSEDLPRWFIGDITRVRQIVLNLLSNAVKFTDAGEIRLTAGFDPADSQVIITVTDTGPGIDADTRERLFQGFTQGDSSTARRFGGTGLGLAISRDLARLMGGDIRLDDRPQGTGASFTFTAAMPPAEAPVRKVATALAGHFPLRVLVVDDNAVNQAVARALLEALGVSVACVGSGPEAVALVPTETFDLVFMDIHMPGMSGAEALQKIRALTCGAGDLPVVALTADAMAGERERLLALGFDDYLSKPINPAALVGVLSATAAPESAAA